MGCNGGDFCPGVRDCPLPHSAVYQEGEEGEEEFGALRSGLAMTWAFRIIAAAAVIGIGIAAIAVMGGGRLLSAWLGSGS